MKILMCGDVVGRTGRNSLKQHIPQLRPKVDFVIVNADNAAHGFGLSPTILNDLFDLGVDVVTGGNHLFDQKEILPILSKEKRLLRPDNMSPKISGSGVFATKDKSGRYIVVIHLAGQHNMSISTNNPFNHVDEILKKYQLGANASAIAVDFHAEATSEKNALGHYLDGRVSLVVGTHTHIPTADYRVLPNGTAYQTDLGMCGDYDSVIGMEKTNCIERFVKGYNASKINPAVHDATFCGLVADIDDATGLAKSVTFLCRDGSLKNKAIDTTPDLSLS